MVPGNRMGGGGEVDALRLKKKIVKEGEQVKEIPRLENGCNFIHLFISSSKSDFFISFFFAKACIFVAFCDEDVQS